MADEPDADNVAAADSLAAMSWDALDAAWNDAALHREFVDLCDGLDRLDLAATRYAESRKKRPGDPTARRMIAQILVLAGMRLDRSPKHSPPSRGSRLKLPLLALFLLCVPLLLLFLFAGQRQTRLELQRRLEARTVSGQPGQGDRR